MIGDWIERWQGFLPPAAIDELMAAADPAALVMPEIAETSEGGLQSEIRRVASVEFRAPLWRNNNGAMTTSEGRHIRFGLGNDSAALNRKWKSSDLIGISPDGKFLAVEVKKPGWRLTPGDKRAQAQAAFMRSVTSFGGRAGFVQSVEDFRRLMHFSVASVDNNG